MGRCVGSASCSTVDAVAVNFTRLLSKNVEHTFGASLPKFGAAHAHGGYSNAEFRAARAAGDASYAFMERSWRENDQFGVAAPLAALAEDSRGALAEFVREELARLPAQREPDLTGFRAVGASFVLRGWLRLGIDQETGGLSSCVDLRDPSRPREWAAPASPLALLQSHLHTHTHTHAAQRLSFVLSCVFFKKAVSSSLPSLHKKLPKTIPPCACVCGERA